MTVTRKILLQVVPARRRRRVLMNIYAYQISFFLSRLVVSTVVATLAVHASSPIFSTTTHYSYNPMGPAEGVYTCARPEAPSSVPRLTKHSRSMSRASNRPRPQLAREDRKKSGGSITESQKGLPGRAGRGRWAAREVAGGQRRAAARRELHGVIRRRDIHVTVAPGGDALPAL